MMNKIWSCWRLEVRCKSKWLNGFDPTTELDVWSNMEGNVDSMDAIVVGICRYRVWPDWLSRVLHGFMPHRSHGGQDKYVINDKDSVCSHRNLSIWSAYWIRGVEVTGFQ